MTNCFDPCFCERKMNMKKEYQVAILVGSLRKDSINRKVANALVSLAPVSMKFTFVEIRDLPLYNPDEDATPPAAWTRFRAEVASADAILFVTPEHNHSMPAALKNAIDVGSRPYGQSVWNGKPGAVVSASPGSLSGFGANQHVRQTLVFLNVPTLQQPEVYLGAADKLFDASGQLVNEGTRAFLEKFMQAFDVWVGRFIRTESHQ
jgi:chromate reductase